MPMLADPVAAGQLQEQRAVEAAGGAVVDILDAATWRSLAVLARLSKRFCWRSVLSRSSRRPSHSA